MSARAKERWEREDAERRWAHYAKCEGSSRSFKRHQREDAHAEAYDRGELDTSLEDVESALRALTRARSRLVKALRYLPEGETRKDRHRAVMACLDAELTQAEVARACGVSRARIAQIVKRHQEIPF